MKRIAVGLAAAVLVVSVGQNSANGGELHVGSSTYSRDFDGDGIVDWDDNSPRVSNPGQEDSDGDGWGDASDPSPSWDADADNYSDGVDVVWNDPNHNSRTFDIDGPYVVTPGGGLMLSISTSPIPYEPYLLVRIDVGNDGTADAWWTGEYTETIDMTWPDVQALGLDSGVHALEVTAKWRAWSSTDLTSTSVIPEPSTLLLVWPLLLALGIFAGYRRKRK